MTCGCRSSSTAVAPAIVPVGKLGSLSSPFPRDWGRAEIVEIDPVTPEGTDPSALPNRFSGRNLRGAGAAARRVFTGGEPGGGNSGGGVGEEATAAPGNHRLPPGPAGVTGAAAGALPCTERGPGTPTLPPPPPPPPPPGPGRHRERAIPGHDPLTPSAPGPGVTRGRPGVPRRSLRQRPDPNGTRCRSRESRGRRRPRPGPTENFPESELDLTGPGEEGGVGRGCYLYAAPWRTGTGPGRRRGRGRGRAPGGAGGGRRGARAAAAARNAAPPPFPPGTLWRAHAAAPPRRAGSSQWPRRGGSAPFLSSPPHPFRPGGSTAPARGRGWGGGGKSDPLRRGCNTAGGRYPPRGAWDPLWGLNPLCGARTPRIQEAMGKVPYPSKPVPAGNCLYHQEKPQGRAAPPCPPCPPGERNAFAPSCPTVGAVGNTMPSGLVGIGAWRDGASTRPSAWHSLCCGRPWLQAKHDENVPRCCCSGYCSEPGGHVLVKPSQRCRWPARGDS